MKPLTEGWRCVGVENKMDMEIQATALLVDCHLACLAGPGCRRPQSGPKRASDRPIVGLL